MSELQSKGCNYECAVAGSSWCMVGLRFSVKCSLIIIEVFFGIHLG